MQVNRDPHPRKPQEGDTHAEEEGSLLTRNRATGATGRLDVLPLRQAAKNQSLLRLITFQAQLLP